MDPLLQTMKLKGSKFVRPTGNPKYLRLYGHPLCPYVERSLHTLALKKAPFQFVQLDMPSRPQWYFDLPSKGKIPLLELPNASQLITESAIVAQFINNHFPNPPNLMPNHPLLQAKVSMILAKIDDFIPHFYKLLRANRKNKNEGMLNEFRTVLGEFDDILGANKSAPFFLDMETPTFADIFLYPHFCRLLLFEGTEWESLYEGIQVKGFERLGEWIHGMQEIEEIKQNTVNPNKQWELCTRFAETNVFALTLDDDD